jgi:two-component system sensor histidine kinase and response regulator WspE
MNVAIVKPTPEKPLAILCADDHTLVGDALMKVFATAGYDVERASDGEEAWGKLAADLKRFDVLITDHEMPRLTGLQLVGRLRDARFPGRIIVYSAAVTDEDQQLYRGMGVEAIVVKSPEPAKLLAVVKALHRQE